MVPQDMLLWFHTHDTASNAIAQNLAAIEVQMALIYLKVLVVGELAKRI